MGAVGGGADSDFVRLLACILFARSGIGVPMSMYGCRAKLGLMLGCRPYASGGISCCSVGVGSGVVVSTWLDASFVGNVGYNVGCLVVTCSLFLGSVCICASCRIMILSPSGDFACCRSCGSGTTPMSGVWKAVNAAVSRSWFVAGWWGVLAGGSASISWYIVNILVPISRT